MRLMFHDDSCGELLDAAGQCPKCGFHPDMQSTGFVEVADSEIDKGIWEGRTYLTKFRQPVT
jgi:hypothetical protein